MSGRALAPGFTGNPAAYQRLKQHPGDADFGQRDFAVLSPRPSSTTSAAIPGQARGIPDITPALPLFAQIRRFTLAVLAAAETAADFARILYTDAPTSTPPPGSKS